MELKEGITELEKIKSETIGEDISPDNKQKAIEILEMIARMYQFNSLDDWARIAGYISLMEMIDDEIATYYEAIDFENIITRSA